MIVSVTNKFRILLLKTNWILSFVFIFIVYQFCIKIELEIWDFSWSILLFEEEIIHYSKVSFWVVLLEDLVLKRDQVFTKFREVLVNFQEFFQMRTFLNGRNENKILDIRLKHFSSVFNHIALELAALFFNAAEVGEALLWELVRTWWEFNIGILVNEFLVQRTKSLVFLSDNPCFIVEVHLQNVFRVLPIVNWIYIYPSLANA